MQELQIINSNKKAFVDDSDYSTLSKYKWYCNTSGNIFRNSGAGQISLAQTILKTNKLVDHKDLNSFNNSKLNLREGTQSLNVANTEKRTGSFTSKYKGVYWYKRDSKWRAGITLNYRSINLGSFSLEIDAAKAYNDAAIIAFGEFARLNIINYDIH